MPVHKKKYDVVTTFPNYDLHGAAAAGNIGLVTYAITHGQPINAVLGGLLPLHAAASGGSVDVVQLLIDHGADVNAPRMPSSTGPPMGVGGAGSIVGPGGIVGDGNATSTSAAERHHRGRLGSAGGLVHHHHHHGAPPSSSSASTRPGSANNTNNANAIPLGRRGSTPLHFAAAMGKLDVVRLLLENGAKPSAKDADKNTPEAVAREAGRSRVADFLRDWEGNQYSQGGTGTPRRSLDNPQVGVANTTLRPNPVSPDFKFGTAENGSTASLPLVPSPPAALSTSSLGRYPNQPGRRPSLPSIYESPPSTSYPRPNSSKRQDSEPTKPSAPSSSSTKLPFSIRRPKSAGNKDAGRDDDASSQISHQTSSTTQGTASRTLNRIFKRPNLRPATASGALSTTSSPTSPSPPVVGRSRSPSASKISEKDRSGGFFHHAHLPHLPHLPRRDHAHAYQQPQNPHHLHLHHVARDAISGPITHGQSPSTSIPDIAHPEMTEMPLTGSTNPPSSSLYYGGGGGEMNTPSDEVDEEEAMSRALNFTPAELQYAKARGALPDRLKSASITRTAPPSQTSFGIPKKPSYSTLNHYPSHTGLSTKASYSTLPSPKIVPRHRANLGPGGGLAMTTNTEQGPGPSAYEEFGNRSRTDTPLSFGSTTMDAKEMRERERVSPAAGLGVRAPHPIPSLTSLNRQVRNMRAREKNGSISSLDSALTGTSGSAELSRSPLGMGGGEDLPAVEYPTRATKMSNASASHSPSGRMSPPFSSAAYGSGTAGAGTGSGLGMSDYAVGILPLSDGRLISSRAQASELVEAHKKAIQSSHDLRSKARRKTGASSLRGQTSPLSDSPHVDPQDAPSPNLEVEEPNVEADGGGVVVDADADADGGDGDGDGTSSLEEEDVTSLREKLAALGESVQIERTFAKREQQARRWNRESGHEGASVEDVPGDVYGTTFAPSSLGPSMIARNEMLEVYLRPGQSGLSGSDSEKVKKVVAPKRDVFGRPVTPKKEGRPPTPKDTRPPTPKNIPLTPTGSRMQEAPRENRVLPPASRAPVRSATTHLTLQQTRAISKSDLALGSHVNKEAFHLNKDIDLQGRERAWTTTDVRPRIGPTSASRPSTAGSKLGGNVTNGNLTIDITQTMPTPTDGGATPLRGHSPMTPSRERQDQETIQSRRRVASNPLRIDAQVAQERAASKESSEDGPRPSPNTMASQADQRRQRSTSNSKPRRAATPTKGEPSTILLQRITTTPPVATPAIALVPPSGAYSSFLSVSSGAQDSPIESPVQTQMAPIPPVPSAVSLHNSYAIREREEAAAARLAESQAGGRQASPSPPTQGQNDSVGRALTAGERRLGLGATGTNGFGFASVRSFNEEKAGADGPWKLMNTDSRDSDVPAAKTTKSKINGLFSRLKRAGPG